MTVSWPSRLGQRLKRLVARDGKIQSVTSTSKFPFRPEEPGYLQRVWDHLYGDHKESKEKSVLEYDIASKLKHCTMRQLYYAVHELLLNEPNPCHI